MATRNETTGDIDTESTFLEQRELQQARDRCRRTIANRLSTSKVLGDADKKVYDIVMTDESMASIGIVDHQEKLRYIREEVERSMVNQILNDADSLERTFRDGINSARGRWISAEKADWWIRQLEDPSIPFHKKHLFMTTKAKQEGMGEEKGFEAFVNNWRTVAEGAEKIRSKNEKILKQLTNADVPDIDAFRSKTAFIALPWKKRKALLDTVDAAIKAKEKQMPHLYKTAKAMLDDAVIKKALSSHKVGTWLNRIFSSNAKPQLIEDFIHGSGATIDGKKMTLGALIANWSKASAHFRDIEDKREKFGTPRSFHFVSMEVFLDWNYERRKSYLTEAEHRFTDINKEPYVFLMIRHALDCKDWEEADELLKEVQHDVDSGNLLMGEENKTKMKSMSRYLLTHREPMLDYQKLTPNPQELVDEMNEALQLVNQPWIRDRFVRAMGLGYQTLWALCTINFNWEWCRNRGFSSDKIDADLRETAKEDTWDHIKHGQPKSHVNNDMTNDTSVKSAPRWSTDTNSAQAIHVDHTTSNEILVNKYIHENANNRSVWYWTRIMEKDTPYEEMQRIIHDVQPILKRNMRKLKGMGMGVRGDISRVKLVAPAAMVASAKSVNKDGAPQF